MSNQTPSDTPTPSPSPPRRAASSSSTRKTVSKAVDQKADPAVPRVNSKPAFARKNPSAYRGGRVRDRKVETAEVPLVEATESERLEDAANEVTEAIVGVEETDARGAVAESNFEGERGGNRSESMPQPPRDPRREDPRRDHRPHDRGPRPNRHERPERPDRWDRPPPPRPERMPLDLRELSDKAWLLFAAELREEGVTFVDDTDAEKLTNRCFRLAEIFIRQRQRRLNSGTGSAFPEDRRRDELRPQRSPLPKQEFQEKERQLDESAAISEEESGD